MNNVRTVSDTKRAFYQLHTRPINSIYRRVVEELMVEMHLLGVNEDFRYDPIYALGVISSFERFMQGYRSEQEKTAIFDALCQATETAPQQYRQDAKHLQEVAAHKSQGVIEWIEAASREDSDDNLQLALRAIATNPRFKYSRLFGIGLYTLLESADPDLVKNEPHPEVFHQVCAALNLPVSKLQKDLELYRSNLEKMAQAHKTMEDLLQVNRKKRQSADSEETPSTGPQAPSESPK